MKSTSVFATSLIAVALPILSGQTLQANGTERFGLRMGMEKAEVIASVGPNSVEKDLGDVLILTTTPKPDANFVRYVLLVPPEIGLIKVVAISNDVTTHSSGESLRDKFNELRSSLEADYGKAALVFDFLIPGSNWNEPNDWMMALLNHERIFMANWKPDAEGVSIAEKACAISSQTGYIIMIYEFPNFSLWKQSPSEQEDRFFTPLSMDTLIARTDVENHLLKLYFS